jgi:hypothetical protein
MRVQVVVRGGAMSDRTGVSAKMRLDQRYEPPLGIAVAIDIALRGLNRPMAGEQLNVPERATGFVDQPSRARNKGSPARMRRAAVEPKVVIGALKPHHHTQCRHRSATLGPNDETRCC